MKQHSQRKKLASQSLQYFVYLQCRWFDVLTHMAKLISTARDGEKVTVKKLSQQKKTEYM